MGTKEKLERTLELRRGGKTWAEVAAELGLSHNGIKKWAARFNAEYPEWAAAARKQRAKDWERGRALVLKALEVCKNIHEAMEYTGLKRSTFDMRIRYMRERGVEVVVPPGFYRDKDMDGPRGEMVVSLDRRLRSYQARAEKKGLLFDLDREWVRHICERQQGKCMYTGWDMTVEPGPKQVTVDRVDPNLGYTKSNCVLACWAANTAKSNLGLTEFAELAHAVSTRFSAATARAQR